MKELAIDCLKLIENKLTKKITMQEYILEIELLDVKYPGIGFKQSASDLQKWLESKNPEKSEQIA